jgi:hypothetical protein
MPGDVQQFIDYTVNTNADTGENNSTSILPLNNAEPLDSSHIGRPGESLRQRTEAIRSLFKDSLYLRDADRGLVIAGPGLITWPGSTTASASGIPVISDNLYILPMLTPGSAQTPPVPPVASAFGTLTLQKVGPANGIVVTSLRRSYANGDQISIDVAPGATFSCTLDVETTYQRTIHIVATGATTLSATIAALAALTPTGPAGDTTPIVSAALAGGALGTDLLLTTQAKQYVSGNFDGEGHTITPANLASFFSGNPSSALAEGDTLCIAYDQVSDTSSTGGRRQSIPENSNTAVSVGAFFNSRVNPSLLVNALPICKVVNGTLVFATGAQLAAGVTNVSLATNGTNQSKVIRNGDFGHGHLADTTRYAITDWENRSDLATNASWALGTTSPLASAKDLELSVTATSGCTARVEQEFEIPVVPGQSITVVANVRQLIAPTGGLLIVGFYWGDLNSVPTTSIQIVLGVSSTTDASYRNVAVTFAVPAGAVILKLITLEVDGFSSASTGVALLVGSLQVEITSAALATPAIDVARLQARDVGATIYEDVTSYSAGQLAALFHYLKASPTNEGTLFLERRDQTYGPGSLPPALGVLGRIVKLGLQLLNTSGDSLSARVSAPYNATASNYTLLLESDIVSGSGASLRVYMTYQGTLTITSNASYTGAGWVKDVAAQAAFNLSVSSVGNDVQWSFRAASAVGAWISWTIMSQVAGPEVTTPANPQFSPLLQVFDAGGNARTAIDHLGLRGGRVSTMDEAWWDISMSAITNGTTVRQWTFDITGTGSQERAIFGASASQGFYGIEQVCTAGSGTAEFFTTSPVVTGIPANAVVVLEWETQVSAGGIGSSTSAFVTQGLDSTAGGGGGTSKAFFSANGTSPNWQLVTQGAGPSTTVNTSVAIASAQRLRLELYGSATPGGAQVLAYINGVLVAQSTTNLPTQEMSLFFETATTSPAVTVDVSPINFRFARVLADDAL